VTSRRRRAAGDGFYRHLREWFTAFLPRQRGAAGNTITSCRHTWNMLLGYAAGHHHVAVEKITFAMVDRATVTAFLDHMRTTKSWTASTYNQRLACIRSFFAYAAAAEPVLAVYLADLAAIPRLKGPAAVPVKYMSADAVAALLAAPDPGTRTGLRDQFFMILMYDLAARDGEMLAMRLVDLDARRLTVDLLGKGSKPRRLPITTQTARHFERYAAVFHTGPDPAAPMFYAIRNYQPARMSDDNAARFIRQHAATGRARCPDLPDRVHPHMLRHSRAMHLYQNGMPLALLSEWLGHANLETTLIYAHADTEMKRHALEKANSAPTHNPPPAPLWHNREDIIQRLCGLK
jgi:site-specific recombinase XerD